MGHDRGALSDMTRIICYSALFSISSVIIVLNNLSDQYFVTIQDKIQIQAYTLDVPFFWIMMAAGAGLSAVYSLDIRKHIRSGNIQAANEAAIRALVYSVIFGIGFSVISFLFMSLVFFLFADHDVAEQAAEYLLPLHIFYFVISLNSVLGGILNAEGKFKSHVTGLLIMLVANFMFDTLFVKELGLGLFGNGMGTVCAAAVALAAQLFLYAVGRTQVKLSLANFRWSSDAAWAAFMRIKLFLVRHLTKDLAELGVRFTIYLVYSLTYGIPMLFSALIATVGAGAGAYLSSEYEKLYVSKDRKGVKRLFIRSTIAIMSVTFLMAVLMFIFADDLTVPFQTEATEESIETMQWTMRILVFTAPFVSLKYLANAVSAPVGRFRNATAMLIVWASVKVIAVVYAAEIDYWMIIYVILIERILAAIVSVILTIWHIRNTYEHADAAAARAA